MQPPSAAHSRLDALTSLRFFAAFHVLLVHLGANGMLAGAPRAVQKLAAVGYLGVNFFFVLSGFVLVYAYDGRRFAARDFWQARFARIYPAYAASLLFSLPMFSWVLIHLNFPFLEWAKQHLSLTCLMVATLSQSWVPQIASAWNPVAWSLAVEAFFYLCFPLLFPALARVGRRRLLAVAAAAWAASLTLGAAYVVLAPDGVAHPTSAYENLFWLNVLRFNPLSCLPEFLVGMAAGLVFTKSRMWPGAAAWLALAGAAGFIAVVIFSDAIPYPTLHSGLLSPAFAAVIFAAALRPGWMKKLLEARWLVLLGDASYSLYLLHFTVIWMALVWLGHGAATFAGDCGVVAASIALSLASYKFIEQPARRKLRELSPGRPAAAAAGAVSA
ncbi:MAG TPA: acyltransferase [Terriglobales bacterium]|nr:acyltransferase [Terriglobales bacterium]